MDNVEQQQQQRLRHQNDLETRERLLENEMRSFENLGFHDGYHDGKQSVVQNAFDCNYQKAFEQNFALSTLKGVAQALKSSARQSQNTSALKALKFDDINEIECIKTVLIDICNENKFNILAHYVSQIH